MSDGYIWKDVTEEKLRDCRFVYNRGFSTEDNKAFLKTIPLYKYSEIVCLEARIVVYTDGEVLVDVLDSGFHGYYAPWYLGEDEERYPILKTVNQKLETVLKKYGIKRKNDERKNKKVNRLGKDTYKSE